MGSDNWVWLSTRDQASNNWILYREIPPVELRPRYRSFCCPSCGKVDEDVALQSGFDNDIVLKSRCDIFHSSDGILCFSERARAIWHSHALKGLKFLPLPNPNKLKHEVALPTIVSQVDREKSGFQWTSYPAQPQPELNDADVFCPSCQRPRNGAYVGPFGDSMTLPEDHLSVTTPSISPENQRGKIYWILVSPVVRDILIQSRLIGVDFVEPF